MYPAKVPVVEPEALAFTIARPEAAVAGMTRGESLKSQIHQPPAVVASPPPTIFKVVEKVGATELVKSRVA